jgi:hypothetical protein
VEKRVSGWLAGTVLILVSAGAARGATVVVTSAADSGPGTFRAAVAAANVNPGIDTVKFRPHLFVTLASEVAYTGPQDLSIMGQGSTIAGDGSKDDTWGGGLFVSRSAAAIDLASLDFVDSFNNGVGVFIPASATGVVKVSLRDVAIERSRFHGLYVDGQVTTGFNTDDEPHPMCVDPWSFDSAASIVLEVLDSDILDNGTVVHEGPGADYDASLATGCPVDFDGVRVDEGGDGGIDGTLWRCAIERNRADGVEYDERGDGGVTALTQRVSLVDNGDTGTDDADDGFDIDESGNGHLRAAFERTLVAGNFDEGLDFTEQDAGNLRVVVLSSESSSNEDEGVKLEEGGEGDLALSIKSSKVNDCLSQQGVEATELGGGNLWFAIESSEVERNDNDGINLVEEAAGDLDATIDRTTVKSNGDHAVVAEQETTGAGSLLAIDSDLTGNADTSLDLSGVTATLVGTAVDP